ncbi:MAG TPA: PRC-barrel domain-containing protein [Xanthobacteraceae bacterium]|nr:PRC-barrel domain-containing protein [Xanthobacteraceae bacterium]
MRGEHPIVMAAAALLALTAIISVASSENGPAPPAPAPAKTEQPAPPGVTILPNHEVEGILGREVRSSADENMGRIVDVLVVRGGQVRAAIIDFGGFLGVGSRKIAVDWAALHFPVPVKPESPIKLELNRDQVNAAPAYEDGKPVVVLSALGKLEPLPIE